MEAVWRTTSKVSGGTSSTPMMCPSGHPEIKIPRAGIANPPISPKLRPDMSSIQETLTAAVANGSLLASAKSNITALLDGTTNAIAPLAIQELADAGAWEELNDRFFKTLAFGTGGLRGRTIGRVVTKAEQGAGGPNGRPEHPCIGTATMNFYNLSR